MSELLYLLGELDSRVRPLVFCIRRWALLNRLTLSQPGNWISNFGLTCLVIFFLQQLEKPILPTINYLNERGRPVDKRPMDASFNVTYLRDFSQLNGNVFHTENTSTVGELLLEFMTFYAEFNFLAKTLSLHTGNTIEKSGGGALHIINPLEPKLNVTKNVHSHEMARIRDKASLARILLETHFTDSSRGENDLWGIAQLFETANVAHNTVVNQAFANILKPTKSTTDSKNIERLTNIKHLYEGTKTKTPSTVNGAEEKGKILKSGLNLRVDKKTKANKDGFEKKRSLPRPKASKTMAIITSKKTVGKVQQLKEKGAIGLSADLSKILNTNK